MLCSVIVLIKTMLFRIRIRIAILMSIQIWVCLPDWHQNNADPNADPSPSFAHFGKLGLNFFTFFQSNGRLKIFLFTWVANVSLQCFGSGIRCLFDLRTWDPVPFWPLDPGSRIPNPYFWELSDTFLGKKFFNSFKICLNFFSSAFQN